MTRNGINIWEYPYRRQIHTGIMYESLVPGSVPEFEEREAAVYCNYTPTEFRHLPVEERARCVAQYRLRTLIDNHVDDASASAGPAR